MPKKNPLCSVFPWAPFCKVPWPQQPPGPPGRPGRPARLPRGIRPTKANPHKKKGESHERFLLYYINHQGAGAEPLRPSFPPYFPSSFSSVASLRLTQNTSMAGSNSLTGGMVGAMRILASLGSRP